MDTLSILLYLLKVSVALALFYGLHMLFLRGETFLVARRLFFLVAIAFAFLFPFIHIDMPTSEPVPVFALIELPEVIINPTNTASLHSFSAFDILVAIVLIGSCLLVGRLLIQLGSVIYIVRSRPYARINGCRQIDIDDARMYSFSFFGWIIINTYGCSTQQRDDIIKHETTHALQHHSVDVLLYELVCALLWWNPFAWLLKKEMKLNLEYLADHNVQQNKENRKEYQYLLLATSLVGTNIPITNNLNVSQLKKRIEMMNKKQSKKRKAMKYLLLLPLTFALVALNSYGKEPVETVAVSNSSASVKTEAVSNDKKIYSTVNQVPEFTGGTEAMYKFVVDNMNYPTEALKAGVQGRVSVRFVVTETGNITDVEIMRSISPECDAEAIRVVKAMPKWKPGIHEGKAVATYYAIPISYRITASESE